MKLCSSCGEPLQLSEFYKRKGAPDGLRSNCKTCHKAAVELYRQINIDKKRVWQKGYRDRNQLKLHQYYLDNLDKRRIYRKQQYWANRAAAIKAASEWNKNHPLQARLVTHRRRARLRKLPGRYGVHDIRMLYEQQQGHCTYCYISLEGIFHVDHIIPVSKGGSNYPSNLCLACAPCNREKHTMTGEQFRILKGKVLEER